MTARTAEKHAIPTSVLRDILDRVYERYNRREFIGSDPLQFVYQYTDSRDREIVAFLSSALAYGRVPQIQRSLAQLFDRMDGSPYEFTARFNERGRARLRGFKHRFTTGDDIADLLGLFRRVLDDCGSLEAFFLQGYREEHANILPALSGFCESLIRMNADSRGRARNFPGLSYLLASPSRGSACKRLNLFLRWMVRRDEVDVGLWKSVDKAKLIVPVDVHMCRLSRILGFHDSKAATLATALKITEAFARIEPADPVKYDFALSRIGIVEDCDGRPQAHCDCCELGDLCRRRK
ncbi:MAG: TIGR02757 family protein [Solirubrobacterales bacterium]